MTVTVRCEKTGIQFEAATARTKNHPKIMTIINQAAKENWYGLAMEALKDGKELGFSTIEQFVEALNAAKQQSAADYHAFIQKQFADKAARRERAILNAKLASHGYEWVKVGFATEEDADAFDLNMPIGQSWTLVSPDKREVSVAQALAEIGG